MLDHSAIPTIFGDEDGYMAACECGWQTDLYETKSEAIAEYEQIHFFGNPRDEDEPTSDYDPYDEVCHFCGNPGHFKATCPHKPLYKVS